MANKPVVRELLSFHLNGHHPLLVAHFFVIFYFFFINQNGSMSSTIIFFHGHLCGCKIIAVLSHFTFKKGKN